MKRSALIAALLAACVWAQTRRVTAVIEIRITYWDPAYRLKDVLAVLAEERR